MRARLLGGGVRWKAGLEAGLRREGAVEFKFRFEFNGEVPRLGVAASLNRKNKT